MIRQYLILFHLTCSFLFQGIFAQEVKFNEVLPSNKFILQDEDGDYPDWFELKNNGNLPIDLTGFSVSNNQNEIFKWQFPAYPLGEGEILIVYASGKDRKTTPIFNHTIINQGDTWKYHLPSSEVTGWRETDFNDNGWQEGPSGFGYGDNDDATIIPQTMSVFLRKDFFLEDTSRIKEMMLHIDYDDGFVAYLNGTEIARANLGTMGVIPAFNQPAITYTEPVMHLGGIPESFKIQEFKRFIKPGKNLLAIQVHNNSTGSSDLTAIPFLTISQPGQPLSNPPGFIPKVSGGFHTNFKISVDGDSLYLYDPSGIKVDEFISKKVPSDISLGYKPGDYSTVYGFAEPTPWEDNTGEALLYSNFSTPVFDPPGGYYPSSFNLKISITDPQDSIFYTTDGSEPGSDDFLYTGEILIDKPITIRAKVFRTGKIPGDIISQSYLVGIEKNLPIVFISTDPDNLFDYQTGIYVKGPRAQSSFPYFDANFWQDWEKPAHIDYYDFETGEQFGIDAGIKIYGAWSRGHPQKSLAIYARSIYGDKAIYSKIFKNSSLDKFETLVLRNSGNDWFGEGQQSGVLFRDLFMTSVGRDISVDAQAGRPVVVYINGQYWGIHNLREKINEHFVADNHDKNPDEINLLEANGRIVEGSNTHYNEMLDYLKNNDISQEQHYRHISGMMNIDEFIRYNMLQIYYYNGDWPGNNIKFWKGSGPLDAWRWILYDTDFGFGIWDLNKVYHRTLDFATTATGPDWPNPPWSTFLLRTLLKNEAFKHRFINTFGDHLNTTLLSDSLIKRIDRHTNDISAEMTSHIQRWGGNYSNWTRNVNNMRSFASTRPYQMQLDILQFFKISYLRDLKLEIAGCENATIIVNTIEVKHFPWSGKYFDKIPIELIAIPPEGYRFVRWEGSYISESPDIKPQMESNKNLRAVFEPIPHEIRTGIVINEIFYRGNAEVNSGDWVELYNMNDNFASISAWEISDNSNNKNFVFPEPTLMPPHGYLVICRDIPLFRSFHPTVDNHTGELAFGFSSDGDCIRLFNHKNELVDSVCYGYAYPWPTEPNGMGYSLMLRDPESDNSLAVNWYSSVQPGGTPGVSNTIINTPGFINAAQLRVYPNPFSNSLKISLYQSSPGETKLYLADLNGRIVSSIYDDFLTTGVHSFNVDGYHLENGIYFLYMILPDKSITEKIIKHH